MFTFLQDLIKELKSELNGHFAEVVLGLLMTPVEYDSFQLRRAMKVCCCDLHCLFWFVPPLYSMYACL